MHGWVLALMTIAVPAACWTAPLEISVRICRQSDITADELDRAKNVTRIVLNQAGGQIRWFDCVFNGVPSTSELMILIRGRSSERQVPRLGTGGSAVVDRDGRGAYALAYYDDLRELARKWGVPAPTLLGYVIVHEVGHLSGLRHGTNGIMCTTWRKRDLELMEKHWLFFTPAERNQLSAALRARQPAAESHQARMSAGEAEAWF